MGFRAQHESLYSASQQGTTWQSDLKLVRKGVGLRDQHRTLCAVTRAYMDVICTVSALWICCVITKVANPLILNVSCLNSCSPFFYTYLEYVNWDRDSSGIEYWIRD